MLIDQLEAKEDEDKFRSVYLMCSLHSVSNKWARGDLSLMESCCGKRPAALRLIVHTQEEDHKTITTIWEYSTKHQVRTIRFIVMFPKHFW
jgi:hypothetical protein